MPFLEQLKVKIIITSNVEFLVMVIVIYWFSKITFLTLGFFSENI